MNLTVIDCNILLSILFNLYIYILFITDQRFLKKVVLKSITDLCYSSSVIKNKNLKNFECVKKIGYTNSSQ